MCLSFSAWGVLENVMKCIQPDEPDLSESMNLFFQFNFVFFYWLLWTYWVKFEQILAIEWTNKPVNIAINGALFNPLSICTSLKVRAQERYQLCVHQHWNSCHQLKCSMTTKHRYGFWFGIQDLKQQKRTREKVIQSIASIIV